MNLVVGDKSVREWIAWAALRIEDMDPISQSSENIFEALAAINKSNYDQTLTGRKILARRQAQIMNQEGNSRIGIRP